MGSAELVLVLMVVITVLFGRGKVGSLIRAIEEIREGVALILDKSSKI
jgi:Sec-independent protein translocase protein TatA